MSKYTTEQLQEMAKVVMKRPAFCDPQADLLIARLQQQFNLSYDMVMLRICDLSMGLPVNY